EFKKWQAIFEMDIIAVQVDPGINI
ncbi:hypothetical protein LCGC14_2834180, partial [marine sediment metagenome]